LGDFVYCELPCGEDDGSKNEEMDELGAGNVCGRVVQIFLESRSYLKILTRKMLI